MWEQLWRRTVTLVREYPALWLPVIGAEVGGIVLRSFKAAVKPQLLQLAVTHHSVLGGVTV